MGEKTGNFHVVRSARLVDSMLSLECSSPGSVKKRRPSLTSMPMLKRQMCPRISGGTCATFGGEFRELESMTKYLQRNDLSTLRIRSVTEDLRAPFGPGFHTHQTILHRVFQVGGRLRTHQTRIIYNIKHTYATIDICLEASGSPKRSQERLCL